MKKRRVKEDNKDIRKILRLATEADIEKMNESKLREKETMITGRVIINRLKLDMKLSEVEIQADGKKATYYYTAEDRVDFRELIRAYSTEFKMKVEMKQIGIRQEAGKIGGIGSCGRELCCSTWLTSFNAVSTSAARYQNLAINQTKLSGQCGRLKCCLNFELDTYMDALKIFPKKADKLKTAMGTAYLQKKDIFKNLLWYSYRGSSKLYPMSIERVNEIVELNKQGKEVAEMKPVEIEISKGAEEELEFADTVGHISLKSLDRKSRNKRKNKGNRNRNNKKGGNQKASNNNKGSNQPQAKKQPAQKGDNKGNSQNAKKSNTQSKPNSNNKRKPRPQNKKGGNNTAPPKKD